MLDLPVLLLGGFMLNLELARRKFCQSPNSLVRAREGIRPMQPDGTIPQQSEEREGERVACGYLEPNCGNGWRRSVDGWCSHQRIVTGICRGMAQQVATWELWQVQLSSQSRLASVVPGGEQ